MDNAAYDELNLTPVNNDETYSQLRATQTKVRPSDDLVRRADINQSTTKGVKQTSTKEVPSNIKVTAAVLITMIAMLLLLTLTSIALSVATFNRLTSNLKVTSQLESQMNAYGAGLWWRVAYLDMTEPLQQCQSAWREYNTSGVRACGRPVNLTQSTDLTGSCAAVFYFPNRQYSRVSGRIIGYQVASPDAFNQIINNSRGLDGVIISHGKQQDYIWSFAAGVTERSPNETKSNCPCSTVPGTQPPTHIGDNYFCESGNPNNAFEEGQLYSSDRLWDEEQCEGRCCEGTQSPPWFSVQLPAPTTDMIEVSICCDHDTEDEDTPVELMEIYVQ